MIDWEHLNSRFNSVTSASNHSEVIDDTVEKHEMKQIGSGMHRRVYQHPNKEHVVKFASGPTDSSYNRSEYFVWEEANDQQRQCLAEVIDIKCQYRVLLMEKLDTKSEINSEQRHEFASRYSDAGFVNAEAWNLENIGYDDGVLKSVDYPDLHSMI